MSTQPTRPIRDNQNEEVLESIAEPVINVLSHTLDTSDRVIDIEQSLSNVVASSPRLINFTYRTLCQITDNFNSAPHNQGGRLLGEGAFGSVFLGHLNSTVQVAAKCLKGDSEIIKQFQNEVKILSQ